MKCAGLNVIGNPPLHGTRRERHQLENIGPDNYDDVNLNQPGERGRRSLMLWPVWFRTTFRSPGGSPH